jgi:hypothetical protein
MATSKSASIEPQPRPLIQIDDVIREMTEEEFIEYQLMMANEPQLAGTSEA